MKIFFYNFSGINILNHSLIYIKKYFFIYLFICLNTDFRYIHIGGVVMLLKFWRVLRKMKKQIAAIGVICLLSTLLITGCEEQKTPEITSFTVNPEEIEIGQSSQLQWIVKNATSVRINNGIGIVNLTGTYTITPTDSTTYTLTAESSTKTITATTRITVIENIGNVNITLTQNDFYMEIIHTNGSRLNQEKIIILAFNENNSENQTSTLKPTIIDGDGNDNILGKGDIILFHNLSAFPIGDRWDIQLYYRNQSVGQGVFKNPPGPYDSPRVLMIQSTTSVIITGIINGPIQQDQCSIIAINKTSETTQTSLIGAAFSNNDSNPTVLTAGDQIVFTNLKNFKAGDQWIIQVQYNEETIGQCLFTRPTTIILVPT